MGTESNVKADKGSINTVCFIKITKIASIGLPPMAFFVPSNFARFLEFFDSSITFTETSVPSGYVSNTSTTSPPTGFVEPLGLMAWTVKVERYVPVLSSKFETACMKHVFKNL